VPGGVLTIMFNHKQLEAWDALAKSIINAGFAITASWAISTESQHSLHIREKQAVQRTIFLVARKLPRGEGAWWEDIRRELRSAVREKLSKVIKETPHVSRIDLLMSAYGEGLRVVSQHWPVRDSRGGDISIAQALVHARATLQDWYFEARLGHRPDLDTETKVVLYALEGYGGSEAVYDDVRLYGLALGLDVQDLYRGHLAERKRSKVKFLSPDERLRYTSRVDPERDEYVLVWDKVQAAALRFKEDDAATFRRWLRNKGLLADRAFLDACAFLALEGPSDLLETKMARAVAAKAPAPVTGQMTLDNVPE
jgi:adenine-specific DNA methylase